MKSIGEKGRGCHASICGLYCLMRRRLEWSLIGAGADAGGRKQELWKGRQKDGGKYPLPLSPRPLPWVPPLSP